MKKYEGPCSVSGCDNQVRARAFCQKHYDNWRRHGDPLHQGKTLREMFEDLFIPEPNSGCWIWIGAIFHKRGGYGSFTMRPSGIHNQRAHRVSWKLYRRPDLSEDVHILHHCDNVLCVNPEHLFEGDQAANMRDKALKGRQRHGKDHPKYIHGRYVGDNANPEYIQAARVR